MILYGWLDIGIIIEADILTINKSICVFIHFEVITLCSYLGQSRLLMCLVWEVRRFTIIQNACVVINLPILFIYSLIVYT